MKSLLLDMSIGLFIGLVIGFPFILEALKGIYDLVSK